jgi:hypothetical protein
MRNYLPSKLAIISILWLVFYGCSSTEKIAGSNYLLERNQIFKNQEELVNDPVKLLLVDQPNKKVLGIPFKRNLFVLAEKNPDSTFNAWLQKKNQQKKKVRKMAFRKAGHNIEQL